MQSHAANPGRHPLSERGNDTYETPPEATRALLRAENLPIRIWEPACGRGAIVNVLRAAGHQVVATDLVDYGVPVTSPGYLNVDFLMETKLPAGTQAIVTNPPFKLAGPFVRKALALGCPYLAMLLRLAFLEGVGRNDILEHGALSRVHVFRNRLPRMRRDGWEGPQASSSIAFAWFIWDQAHTGPTELHRISWEPA